MTELKAMCEAAGFQKVATYIASGNVVFDAPTTDAAALERRIDAAMLTLLGYEAPSFLRTQAELRRIAAHRPTPSTRSDLPATEHIVFLSRPLKAGTIVVWV